MTRGARGASDLLTVHRRGDGVLEVAVAPVIREGSALTGLWLLESLEAQYRTMTAPMQFDAATRAWRAQNECAGLMIEQQFTQGQCLLRDAVLARVKSPACSDVDHAWLALTRLTHILAAGPLCAEGKVELQFSVRHGKDRTFRLLTVRTPLVERYGQEAADNITAALIAALQREQGKEVRLAGAGPAVPRRAASSDLSFGDFLVYQAFRDYLLRLSSVQCKQMAGLIAAITQAITAARVA